MDLTDQRVAGWPQTWPEGCEGAARHIPGMSRSDVARIREEGGFPSLNGGTVLPAWDDWVTV
jgi:hypothetical protein